MRTYGYGSTSKSMKEESEEKEEKRNRTEFVCPYSRGMSSEACVYSRNKTCEIPLAKRPCMEC